MLKFEVVSSLSTCAFLMWHKNLLPLFEAAIEANFFVVFMLVSKERFHITVKTNHASFLTEKGTQNLAGKTLSYDAVMNYWKFSFELWFFLEVMQIMLIVFNPFLQQAFTVCWTLLFNVPWAWISLLMPRKGLLYKSSQIQTVNTRDPCCSCYF